MATYEKAEKALKKAEQEYEELTYLCPSHPCIISAVVSANRKRKSNELSPIDEGSDQLCHISDERMAKLNSYIDDNHIVLLRSPPGFRQDDAYRSLRKAPRKKRLYGCEHYDARLIGSRWQFAAPLDELTTNTIFLTFERKI
ncbi:6130_t:CDS:2 [Paraglomus occultum]|uniref:6130_t:CDS:1 n=1 Tax=Paraglomus occultum TaxID=144539 RepID=A0A9N9CIM5_9GLOM|nr:6130_t:CDS:2 [Paraglomus occultum]